MKSNDAELASQGRRLAGAVLDGFLFVLTLGIGWVIWYLIVARGRTEPSEATPAYARYPWRWSIGRLGLDADQGLGCACHRFWRSQWGIGGCAGRASGRCHFRAYLRRCSVVVRMGQRPPVRMGQDRAHASCKRSQSIAALCNRPAVKADHSESGVPSRTSPVRSPNSLVKGRSGDVPERTLAPPCDLKINGYRARGVTSKLRLPGG